MMKKTFPFAVILLAAMSAAAAEEPPRSAASAPAWMKEASGRLEKELAGKHGEEARPRLARGLKQVAQFSRSDCLRKSRPSSSMCPSRDSSANCIRSNSASSGFE